MMAQRVNKWSKHHDNRMRIWLHSDLTLSVQMLLTSWSPTFGVTMNRHEHACKGHKKENHPLQGNPCRKSEEKAFRKLIQMLICFVLDFNLQWHEWNQRHATCASADWLLSSPKTICFLHLHHIFPWRVDVNMVTECWRNHREWKAIQELKQRLPAEVKDPFPVTFRTLNVFLMNMACILLDTLSHCSRQNRKHEDEGFPTFRTTFIYIPHHDHSGSIRINRPHDDVSRIDYHHLTLTWENNHSYCLIDRNQS